MTPIKRLIHWGPIASMALSVVITIATISTDANLLWIFIFQSTMCMCLYNMWCATFIGPGYISVIEPSASKANDNQPTKTGRFCRRCSHIVMKKHHHCPWINNCVGQHNETYFVRFLLFTIAVTIQSSAHLIIHALNKHNDIDLIFTILNIGISLGVLIAVSVLLYIH